MQPRRVTNSTAVPAASVLAVQAAMVIAGSVAGAFSCGAVRIAVCACGGIMALWPIKVKVDIKC